ncbi:anoctamin-7 [Octopus bimaculoides]|nr:anoctamin-7 [Octopus bimaculoides]
MSKKSIKGAYPLENYGTISGDSDDKVRILDSPEEESENVEATVINVQHARGNLDNSCFFNDGISKVDFVLVYTEKTDKPNSNDNKMKAFRKKFKSNLIKTGLLLEEEIIKSEKKDMHHIKIHAPWEVLCYYAEDLSFRAPLQKYGKEANAISLCCHFMVLPFHCIMISLYYHFTVLPFHCVTISLFLGSDDHLNFFTSTQRSAAVWEILSTTVYGRRKKAEIGIERMIDEKIISDAFPLHDGPYHMPPEPYNPENLNMRQILYKYWARWGCWYKYQPLDHIRYYFGEKVAIYFAWLGFYTGWLLPAAVVGLLVFLSGAFNISANPIAKHICESGKDYKMCPVCDEDIGCEFWYLSDICIYSEISYLFDHPGTVFYAVFVSFWAISFLEYWKRKNVNLAHHWDVLGFEEEEERPRPAYAAKATEMETNPITGIKEPYFPPKKRIPRILSGMVIIVLMICLVLVFIIAVIMYRVLVSIPLFKNEDLRPRAAIIASTSAAIVNLIFIMLLGKVYERLAFSLTQWEMHRTQTDFEDQLIFKVFLFQFVNFYSSIFYIAFFKGRFVGYPGHYKRFFGLRQEEVSSVTHSWNVISIIFFSFIIFVTFVVYFYLFQSLCCDHVGAPPRIKTRLHRFKIRTKGSNINLEKTGDFSLIRHEGLFDEYLEMSTAFLIAFTSEFLPKMLYQYTHSYDLEGYTNFTLAYSPNGTLSEECRYFAFRGKEGHYTIFFWRLLASRLSFVIIFEHIVFSTFKLIDFAVPDVPESLEQKIKRERYLAKQALADTDALFKFTNRDEEDGMEQTPTGAASTNKAL